jgi:endonuclease YncB( thermonuclease family)
MVRLRDGFAWPYVPYDTAGEFIDAERAARERRRGLWANQNPVPSGNPKGASTSRADCGVSGVVPPFPRLGLPGT